MILCSTCSESINNKGTLTTLVHGKCIICGSDFGKLLVHIEKSRTKKPEEARKIVERLRFWDSFLQKKDEEGNSIFLLEIPEEKMKPGVKKIIHLRRGPKNNKCLYAIATKKGVEFVYGLHHDNHCPAMKVNRLKK